MSVTETYQILQKSHYVGTPNKTNNPSQTVLNIRNCADARSTSIVKTPYTISRPDRTQKKKLFLHVACVVAVRITDGLYKG